MITKIIYFVHGTTTDNERGLATGWAGGELFALGVKQARELGRQVAHNKFDAFFSSDLRRAVDSAELGFGGKYKIVKDPRLREINYGDFTQTPEAEFKHRMNEFVETSYPNGESYRQVEDRISDFLRFLRDNYQGQQVAVMGHQAPQLALEILLNNKTWQQAIDTDWRHTKSWQPGWEYELS